MNKNELTLNQLTAILGGVIAGPNGENCTDRFTRKSIKDIIAGRKRGDHPEIRVCSSEDPGDDDI